MLSSHQGLRKRWLPQAADLAQTGEADGTGSTISSIGCIPTEAALASVVKEPLLAQYRLTRFACMQLLRGELRLPAVCNALHDILLGGNGQFLQAMVDAARRQLARFGELRVRRLDDAVAESLADTNVLYDGATIADLQLHFRFAPAQGDLVTALPGSCYPHLADGSVHLRYWRLVQCCP